MIYTTTFALIAFLGNALAFPHAKRTEIPIIEAGCGELNVFYTGFTAYHPYVAAQNFTLSEVDLALRHGAANLVKAGFNAHIVFQGPEEPLSNLETRMKGVHWDFAAIGFGIRGFRNGTATAQFEELGYMFHELAPKTPIVYNWGPDAFATAVSRRVKLTEDCTDKPGKLLGYEELCDPSLCTKTTNILDGDLSKLTYDEN